jgi:glycosyltransferase involved in cell wall biosynthesis
VHSSFATRAGAEQYVRDLSGALAARGHEIRVFSRPSEHDAPEDQAVHRRMSDRLGTRSGPLRRVFAHLGDMADPTGLSLRDLAAFAPDVVHVHNMDWHRHVDKILMTYGSVRAGRATAVEPTGTIE